MRVSLLALAILGCTHTLEATAIQPNPIKGRRSAGDSVGSEPLYIMTRDMHLPRWVKLRSSASFAAVSRDRVRFHVGIVQYWEEMADTTGWTVWLEDEAGRRLRPQRAEMPRVERVAVEWEKQFYAMDRVQPRHLDPTEIMNVYRGRADYVFVEKDLMGPARRAFTLVLERDGIQLRYEWKFHDDAWAVWHYGVSTNPLVVVVPGPETRVASSTWE